MRNFQLALFSIIICCLVKLNESKEVSKPFLTSEQDTIEEAIPPTEKLSILENSDFNSEDDDVNSREEMQKLATSSKSDQEPGQTKFSSRVRREENQTDYFECGLDMDSLTPGSESTYNSRVWPWMVSLRNKNDAGILCGATIINKRFVMTSVTCVTDSRDRIKNADKVVLTLGSTDGKGGDEDQEFGVRSILVHPKYNHVIYDYDVALLELKKPITFNRYMSPICLPPIEIPENSNLYKPQSLGLGLGWGAESMESLWKPRNRNTLMEVGLIIQHPDACKKNLRIEKFKAHFTERMFCAAEKGPYLCVGNGGGPVMQSQVRADGSRFWTQVGIISWGVGCGPDSYGFHSNVHKLLPWILSKINRMK